jgi:hypothetical protein
MYRLKGGCEMDVFIFLAGVLTVVTILLMVSIEGKILTIKKLESDLYNACIERDEYKMHLDRIDEIDARADLDSANYAKIMFERNGLTAVK